ncbi:hypothetical protein Raf01_17780 [Rugosimonospora africana]|uniref:Uncharacterized protein n=1 Tax=Rugosimonospora africana TaxID=556532 RepID=A0A8J3QN80_9ACTN|nr:hypothetical protein Raf01_17780 [Rugosimonospora africana]
MAAGVAAGLVAAVLVGGVALVGSGNGPAPMTVAAGPPAAPRLFLVPRTQSWEGSDGRPVGLKPVNDLDEVLPDGHLVVRVVPGMPQVAEAVTLPDGGFAALGLVVPPEGTSPSRPNASPTPAKDQGPMRVAVVRPDGSVRSMTETDAIGFIGADDRRVYLYDANSHVIAMDLSTRKQRILNWPDLYAGAVLAGGRFAELAGGPNASPPEPCHLRLLDGQSGAQTVQRTLPSEDCNLWDLALSPDGRWLAIAVAGPLMGNANQLSLILVNVDTGKQTNQLLDQGPPVADSGEIDFQGMAWLDDGQVRVAWTHLPDKVDRMYDKSEVLRVKTVAVPGS